jgi:hypothetical protein
MENDTSAGRTNPTDAQAKAAFMGPAPNVNKCIATLGPTVVRIAFLEEDPDTTPYFRSAVTLNQHDAFALYKMLQVVLQDFEVEFDRQSVAQIAPK